MILCQHGKEARAPRASTTDDVERFHSMMRDTIGKDFTTRQMQFGFRKVGMEFLRRMYPELPFYYHTSSQTWYSEGPLPEFSQASARLKV